MICVDLAGVGVEQPDKVLFADLDVTVARGDPVAPRNSPPGKRTPDRAGAVGKLRVVCLAICPA